MAFSLRLCLEGQWLVVKSVMIDCIVTGSLCGCESPILGRDGSFSLHNILEVVPFFSGLEEVAAKF